MNTKGISFAAQKGVKISIVAYCRFFLTISSFLYIFDLIEMELSFS